MRSLSISGAECVAALESVGFRVTRTRVGATVLVRRERVIIVPDVLVLTPNALGYILDEAELTVERFIWHLGEVTTEVELHAPL